MITKQTQLTRLTRNVLAPLMELGYYGDISIKMIDGNITVVRNGQTSLVEPIPKIIVVKFECEVEEVAPTEGISHG